MKTCLICRKYNGKIYSIDENVYPYPPVHPNCRCVINNLCALLAGTATDRGVNGADWYLKHIGNLPDYYIPIAKAHHLGWVASKGNLSTVARNKMIFGGIFNNKENKLPQKIGRIWYEADINYIGGYRNNDRILFSNDGLIFVTYDHYETFAEIE
ncbi:MAG: ribonuclease domain-containing protein [Oscillospiraceae bacterium]